MTRLSYQEYEDQADDKTRVQLLDKYEDQYAHLFKDGRYPKELFEFQKLNMTKRDPSWKGQNNLYKIVIGKPINYTSNDNKPDLNQIDVL